VKQVILLAKSLLVLMQRLTLNSPILYFFIFFFHFCVENKGDRGVTLSGGQKARLGLARAIYADADLYILDDPLSAVDAAVARHIFDVCIRGHLQKRNKAVLLLTHQIQFLRDTTRILVLNPGGTVKAYGPFQELEAAGVKDLDAGDMGGTDIDSAAILADKKNGEASNADETVIPTFLDASTTKDLFGLQKSDTAKDALVEKKPAQGADPTQLGADAEETAGADKENRKQSELVKKEDRGQGTISLKLYWAYFSSGNGIFVSLVLCFIVVAGQGTLLFFLEFRNYPFEMVKRVMADSNLICSLRLCHQL
jgi:ATP-binding cassette subfamily C (CFTR/MRP) protein 4